MISNIAARLARVIAKNNHRRILGRGRCPGTGGDDLLTHLVEGERRLWAGRVIVPVALWQEGYREGPVNMTDWICLTLLDELRIERDATKVAMRR